MSKSTRINHYVPALIQRRFGKKINVYDLKNGTLCVKDPKKAFCIRGLYEDAIEDLLNFNAESKVAKLLFNKIIDAENEIRLSRQEIILLKKFFAIEQLRTLDTIEYMKAEREYFEHMSPQDLYFLGYAPNETRNLSDEDYLAQTLKSILEYDGFSEEDFRSWLYKSTTTLVAQKWMKIYNSCYIAVWDSKKSGEDFIITDEGMTCEHDPSKFSPLNPIGKELLKPGFLLSICQGSNYDDAQKSSAFIFALNGNSVEANFYLFSLTATRTIVLVDPFFRLYDPSDPSRIQDRLPEPDFWPSAFYDRQLVEKNKVIYEDQDKANQHIFSLKDEYIYKIHDMQLEDVLYYNVLTLDRVDAQMGFGDGNKIARSLATYLALSNPRNDYQGLKNELEKCDVKIPPSQKYEQTARYYAERPVQETLKNWKYAELALKLSQKG